MPTTTLEARSMMLCGGGGDRCEDCPDGNFNPPAQSDCPNFRNETGTPYCDRDDSFERQLAKTIGDSGIAAAVELVPHQPQQPVASETIQ